MEKETTIKSIREGINQVCDDYQRDLTKYLSGDNEAIYSLSDTANRLGEQLEGLTSYMQANPGSIERRMFRHEVGGTQMTQLCSIPLLLADAGPDEELEVSYKKSAQIFLNQLRNLSGLLVSNMKDYKAMQENSSQFNAQELILEEIQQIAPFIDGKNIQINYVGQEKPISIYSDKSLVSSAVSTLIGNSVKYSAIDDKNTQIALKLKEDKKNIIFSITNPYDQNKTSPNVAIGQNLGVGTQFLDEVIRNAVGSSIKRETARNIESGSEEFTCELKIPKKYLDPEIQQRYQRMQEHKRKKSLELITSQ